jgi:threonine/homoserine/homoserine lactone efflux protein
MNSVEFSALLLLTTAASFTPGPNTTLSTALAANFGLKRALGFVLAVPVGWGLLLSLCAGGVGALVVALPMLRLGITLVGVSYLLWLAWRLGGIRFEWRTRTWSQVQPHWHTDSTRLNVTFWQGVLLQFLNIKAWMLALTVVAGWLAGRPDALARFAVVLPVMLMFGLLSNLSYALMGSLLREWLAHGARLRRFNRGMAAVLVLTAIWMATL